MSHARKCSRDNTRTSPLGSIAQEGLEMEIVIPDTLNISDPHTAPRLPVYSSDPRHLQLGNGASGVNTQILMSEIELSPAEEVLIDMEEDPLKLNEYEYE